MRRRLIVTLAVLFWGLPEQEVPRMACRECPDCRRNWPNDDRFLLCPYCQSNTTTQDKVAMTTQIAKDLVEKREADLREFEADWSAAQAVCNVHGLDMADMIVAKRRVA